MRRAMLPIPCLRIVCHKLDFLEAMSAMVRSCGKAKNRMIVVGDLNVAPLPTDVWSHKQLLKVVSHSAGRDGGRARDCLA